MTSSDMTMEPESVRPLGRADMLVDTGAGTGSDHQDRHHPWRWAALYFPFGLTIGFPSIAIGFLASRAGVPLSGIAAIVGASWFVSSWKWIWAPIGDYTLSRKVWYRIAISLVSIGFLALSSIPPGPRTAGLLSLIVLMTSLAGTFIAFSVEGLMAHNTSLSQRGRAGGWFQSGNQFGQTAGGGLGLFLMTHLPAPWMGGMVLAALLWLCSLLLGGLQEPQRPAAHEPLQGKLVDAWRELGVLLRSRSGRTGLLLAILPIGTGAAQGLFSGLAREWGASADLVSQVLGMYGGIAIVAGCFVGGRLADTLSKPWAYAVACGLSALACPVLILSPRTELGFAIGTLVYTFTLGMGAATLTAMVLAIIGHGAAATKINIFFALNTAFSLMMLRVDGWAHDHWGTVPMLTVEATVGIVCLGLFAWLARSIPGTTLAHEA